MANSDLMARLGRLETIVGAMASDVSDLKTNVSDIKADVSDIKADVSDIKTAAWRVAEILSDHSERLDGFKGRWMNALAA